MRTASPNKTQESVPNVASMFSFPEPSSSNGVEGSTGVTDLQWKDLSPIERSAASLGVPPDSWKPISFMNTAHYETLLKTNSLDSELAKRLEAYKHVSAGGS